MMISPQKFLKFLYPRRCPLCDRLLRENEPFVCRPCSAELPFRTGKTCIKCGREQTGQGVCCDECRARGFPFEECVSPFSYCGAVKQAIMRFKYHDRPEYARFFAAAIYYYGQKRIRQWKPDLIVPVPVHRSRLAKRGYNQARLLAEELSLFTGIPVSGELIRRQKRTEAQKELGFQERKDNLKNAFLYNGTKKPPETVLIVDDILTTGSTLGTISGILKQEGARRVFGACICS